MNSTTRIAALAAFCIAAPALAQSQYALTVVGGFEQDPVNSLVSIPQGLNDNGRVVGYGTLNGMGHRGLSWRDGNIVNLGVPAGFDRSFGNAVNTFGHIAGGAAMNDFSASRALRWVGNVMADLGTLGGQHAAALGINNASQVVGYSTLSNNATMRAFLWDNGTMSALPAPTGASDTLAYGINNSGDIIGVSTGSAGSRPVLWSGGVVNELIVPTGTRASSAVAINDLGHIAGTYEIDSHTGEHAGAVWINGQRTDLGFLDTHRYVLPADINDAGYVVGTASINEGNETTGFLWHNGIMLDLRTLLDPLSTSYDIISARAINNSGQIAAVARIDGFETAVILSPIPAPGAAVLLGLAGLLALRRRR